MDNLQTIFNLIKPAMIGLAAGLRFTFPLFSSKSDRGALGLAGLPSRVRTIWGDNDTWPGLLQAIFLATFGILCLRDEIVLRWPFWCQNNALRYTQNLSLSLIRAMHQPSRDGFFKYRWFRIPNSEFFTAYDGGRVPVNGVQIFWREIPVTGQPLDDIAIDNTALAIYMRAALTGGEHVWVVERPTLQDVQLRCRHLRDLIHAEIIETSVILFVFAILFCAIKGGRIVIGLFIFYLILAALLFFQVEAIFGRPDNGGLKGYEIAELSLILCSHGARLFPMNGQLNLPRPEFYQITVIQPRQAPGQEYRVVASTTLELRTLNTRYGSQFRLSVLPCVRECDFLLSMVYGFFWCISTTLVPSYKLNPQQAFVVAVVGVATKFLIPRDSRLFIILVCFLMEAFMDSIMFRQRNNLGLKINKLRDIFSVLTASILLLSLYDWVGL